ncbi:MAG TPA: hypothetical protein VFC00_21065 [Micromonosporaceae bacterium]|nr:hypothetical protein [Micromonosporaceae bacterium]
MTTVPPPRDDGDRPLFAGLLGDPLRTDRPFDAPVVRRPTALPGPAPGPVPAAPSRSSAPPAARPPAGLPPPAPPATAPAPVAPVRRGVLVGRVTGQMDVTRQPRRFFGLPTLLGVGTAATVAACLYATGGALVASVLAALAAVFALMALTKMSTGGGTLGRAGGRGIVRLVSTVVAFVARGAGQAALGTARATTSPGDVTVGRFQLQLVSGEYVTCLAYGELTADALHKDDHVGISGQARKDHYVVRSIEVFSAPGGPVVRRIRPKPSLDFQVMRWVDRASFVLAGLIAAGVAKALC